MLVTILSLSLVACDGDDPEPEVEDQVEEEVEEEPETEEEPEDEEEEEEEEREAVDVDAPDGLSDDLYSFMFSLNGDIYSLPFSFEELEQNGWDGDDLDENTLNPNQVSFSSSITNGDYNMNIAFINLTENVLPFRECNVGRVTFDLWAYERGPGTELIFPGGITIGTAYEDVIATHGEPSDRRETDTFITLTYSPRVYERIEFRIDQETKLVDSLTMQNYEEREAAPEFEGDLPDSVLAYEEPTDLGDNWRDFIVKLDGDLYQLPAPVAAFIDNGWVIEGDPNEMINARSTNVSTRLRLGNQTMRVLIHNYDDMAQPISNGFVTSVEFSHHFAVLPIELPGGITEDSTIEEVIAAFGEPNREPEESSSFATYRFGPNLREEVTVVIDVETDTIHSIRLEHSPRDLD